MELKIMREKWLKKKLKYLRAFVPLWLTFLHFNLRSVL